MAALRIIEDYFKVGQCQLFVEQWFSYLTRCGQDLGSMQALWPSTITDERQTITTKEKMHVINIPELVEKYLLPHRRCLQLSI